MVYGKSNKDITGLRDKKRQLFKLSRNGGLFILECESAVSSEADGSAIGF